MFENPNYWCSLLGTKTNASSSVLRIFGDQLLARDSDTHYQSNKEAFLSSVSLGVFMNMSIHCYPSRLISSSPLRNAAVSDALDTFARNTVMLFCALNADANNANSNHARETRISWTNCPCQPMSTSTQSLQAEGWTSLRTFCC